MEHWYVHIQQVLFTVELFCLHELITSLHHQNKNRYLYDALLLFQLNTRHAASHVS